MSKPLPLSEHHSDDIHALQEYARWCHETAEIARERMQETDDPIVHLQLDAAIASQRKIQAFSERVHAGRVSRAELSRAVEAIQSLTAGRRQIW